jgi:hypothetical protein
MDNQKEILKSYKSSKHPPVYYDPYIPKNNSISKLNRHTSEPHEHKREIARKLRQK